MQGREADTIECKDLVLQSKALRNRWGLSPELRAELVEQARAIMNMHPDARTRVAAMRVLVSADMVDARREGTETGAASDTLTAASRALKVVMKGPEARAMMAKLSERMCGPGETIDARLGQSVEAVAGKDASEVEADEAHESVAAAERGEGG